jgi:hypothetical protein
LTITPLITGGSGAFSSKSAGLSQAGLPAPVQSIGIKILALLHLFLLKFSFQVSASLSPIPKAPLISARGEA